MAQVGTRRNHHYENNIVQHKDKILKGKSVLVIRKTRKTCERR